VTASESLPTDLAAAHALILAERAARLEAETAAASAKAEAASAQADLSSTEALISHLKLEIEKLRRTLYGTRSERKARLLEQMELELEELEAAATEDGLAAEKAATTAEAVFAERGLNSVHIDSREVILTDDHYGKAAPDEAAIEHALKQNVLPLLNAGRVPVMGGFIASCNGITTTLGRGGSDFTAALVGGGLHAGAIEIWTDVDGIMTTDPRICPDALRVRTISFEEAAELAYFGAKVLHPATILPAVQKNIPVFVLNSRNAKNEGTRITATPPPCASPFKSIAAKKKLTIIDIVASRMLLAHGFLKMVFDIFDKHKCAIDMVSTSEVSISVTVDSREALPAICEELGRIADVKYESNKALICLVGEDIRGQSGIAAQVFAAVTHVNIRMISQGASEINMSFMINEEDVEEAVRSLHKKFFVAPDPAIFDVEARPVTSNA